MADVSGVGGGSMQVPASMWQSKVTPFQVTPEIKAQLEAADKATAHAQAVDKEYRDAWAKKTSGYSGLQLGDVAQQSPQTAAGNLAAMTKLRDMYGENGLQVSAMRGDEKTTSFSTYIGWLQERAGAAQVSDLTQASLFSLKV